MSYKLFQIVSLVFARQINFFIKVHTFRPTLRDTLLMQTLALVLKLTRGRNYDHRCLTKVTSFHFVAGL